MATIYIPEREATRDFAAVLAQVETGAKVTSKRMQTQSQLSMLPSANTVRSAPKWAIPTPTGSAARLRRKWPSLAIGEKIDPGQWPMKPMPAKKKSAKVLRCPTCSELVTFDGEDFPFCSDRCRKIDLGKWASGVFKISSPILDPDVLEDLGAFGGGHSKSSDSHDE